MCWVTKIHGSVNHFIYFISSNFMPLFIILLCGVINTNNELQCQQLHKCAPVVMMDTARDGSISYMIIATARNICIFRCFIIMVNAIIFIYNNINVFSIT